MHWQSPTPHEPTTLVGYWLFRNEELHLRFLISMATPRSPLSPQIRPSFIAVPIRSRPC